MTVLPAILAAAAPTAIYTLLIWWLDRYEKEPLPLLAAAFLWGSFPAVLIALLSGALLDRPVQAGVLGPGLGAGMLAPLVEEPIKALPLLLIFRFARSELDGPLDGIVYGAVIGFGFSMSENLLYFLAHPEALPSLFWLRGVAFGLNHALFTGIVGMALGLVRYRPGLWPPALALGLALPAAIGLHALHNYVARQIPGMALSWLVQLSGVLAILAVAVLSWRHEARWIAQELGEEIALGTIGAADYAAVVSAPRRARARLQALLSRGPRHYWRVGRLQHLMTELAFCKYQLSLGDTHRTHHARDELRRQIVALRAQLGAAEDEALAV